MATPIKICHVSSAHERTDDRIFLKECISLREAGYDVSFVVPAEFSEDDHGVHIVAITKYKSRLKRILLGPWQAFFTSLKTKSVVFHLHDPELLPFAILYRIIGKKVIFDSHEDVPRQIYSKAWLGPKWMRAVVSTMYEWLEKFLVLFCVRVISTTQEWTDRFPEKKKVLIRNFPLLSLVKPKAGKNEIPIMIYAGGLSRIRGIKETIQAVGMLQGKVHFWLLGPWSSEEYHRECQSEVGWKYTTYHGMVRPEIVYDYYAKADIGITILYPEKNYLKAFAIKTFEYMAVGIPVIMSNFEYWQFHFQKGAVFVDPTDTAGIAKAIEQLIADPSKMEKLGAEGKAFAMEHFSWENESKLLIETYNDITRGY